MNMLSVSLLPCTESKTASMGCTRDGRSILKSFLSKSEGFEKNICRPTQKSPPQIRSPSVRKPTGRCQRALSFQRRHLRPGSLSAVSWRWSTVDAALNSSYPCVLQHTTAGKSWCACLGASYCFENLLIIL